MVGLFQREVLTLAQMPFTSRDGRIVVLENDSHPKEYLWIVIDTRHFFLGVRVPGLSEDGVRSMANRFLAEHPEHYRAR